MQGAQGRGQQVAWVECSETWEFVMHAASPGFRRLNPGYVSVFGVIKKEDLEAHKGRAKKIIQVNGDMSPAFISGVTKELPKAEITFDKCHVVKLLNEGVDEVRRQEPLTEPCLRYLRTPC